MVGHLSYKQFTQVRFLQLRLCFSGATEAQLFRNQQAVGSNPTGSSYMQVSRNGNAPLCQGGFTGSSPVTCFCPCGVTASTSAFQADDPGSIPGTGFAGEWNGIPPLVSYTGDSRFDSCARYSREATSQVDVLACPFGDCRGKSSLMIFCRMARQGGSTLIRCDMPVRIRLLQRVSHADTVHTTKDTVCYYCRRKADELFDEKEKRDNALHDDLQTA